MTKTKVFGGLLLACLALVLMIASSDRAESNNQGDKKTMLRHVVNFKFKETSSAADVQKVVDGFRGLKAKIPEIASFEFGTNNSPEGLNDGFTHCFLVTFRSEKDRDAYLPHPAHKAFVDVLKPHLDKVMVIDYWAGE
jgi:Stress responsive A/B Barrel Domain